MRLSIIIPVYNAERYVENCVQSVIDQACPDCEVIIVNDGSTDNSLDVCTALARKFNNILVINQKNGGPAKARNEGIKRATGDYLTFVDADDSLEKDYYKTMLDIAEKTKADVIVSDINSVGNFLGKITNNIPKNITLDKEQIKENILANYYRNEVGNISSLVNKLYRRKILTDNNILIDESRVRAEDYWFNFYVFKNANSCIATDKSFYNYNTTVVGSIMKSFRENQYGGFLKTREELLKNNIELNFSINYKKWDSEFVNNTHEYLLLATINNRRDIVNKILHDKTYNDCLHNYSPVNLHTKLIKFFQKNGMISMTKILLKLWSTKVK
ncbi:glycosyltransferase family 2 protein [Chryseobacterium sp. TY4]